MIALALGACQHVGPTSIEMGRADYNSAIQETSQTQLLANIVRVRNAQMPLVMDVTQINAGLSFQANITSQASGIGGQAALQSAGSVVATSSTAGAIKSLVVPTAVELVGGGMIYQETPTITYTPLTGQALIAQLATPITVDSMAVLPDSEWPTTAVLTFAVNYAAPNYLDTSAALNALSALDAIGALTTSAGRSSFTLSAERVEPQAPGKSGGSGSAVTPVAGADDTLTFYVLPGARDDAATNEQVLRLWMRLLRIYWPVESHDDLAPYTASIQAMGSVSAALDDTDKRGDNLVVIGGATFDLASFLQDEFRKLPSWIELRTSPILPNLADRCNAPIQSGDLAPLPAGATCFTLSPVMRTRSALGVLKAAVERPEPLVEFVSPDAYRKIRAEPWNGPQVWGGQPSFYTLLPEDEDSVDCAAGHCDHPSYDPSLMTFFDCYIRQASQLDLLAINSAAKCAGAPARFSAALEHRLATARRFLLIVESTDSPGNALPGVPIFTTWRSGGRWYSIANDDETTKKNFALVSELLTIMAVPNQTGQPQPTVDVGGGGGGRGR
ncbi:MAG TPA: hypothetical protein VGL58_07635 [Caulobacteraceae bacterium]|jgi:hypothetical protein